MLYSQNCNYYEKFYPTYIIIGSPDELKVGVSFDLEAEFAEFKQQELRGGFPSAAVFYVKRLCSECKRIVQFIVLNFLDIAEGLLHI